MEYRHKQLGIVIISVMGFIVIYILVRFSMHGSIHPVEATLAFVLLLVLSLFGSLSVEVSDGAIMCRFGPGLIRRTIRLSEIREVRSVRNPWILGWGMHWLPGEYWLWNVSGLRAVELTFVDGRRFRIGTDEPESLVQAIEANKMANA